MEIAPEWAEVGGLGAAVDCIAGCMLKDQEGLLAHIRALPFVIYVYAM